jgi:hypothetical protein
VRGENMGKSIDEIYKIRISAIFIQSCLEAGNVGEYLVAQAELESLVDEFHSTFPEFVTDEQAENAKKDFDFFLKLIDSTERSCRQTGAD